MDAGPEPIVAPNGVELTAHRLASVTVRAEPEAQYLVDGDRPDGQPVDVLLEQGTLWVVARASGTGVVVSSGAFRIDLVDGSAVIEAGFSGDGLVLVASGHVQLADAEGTWHPLDDGQVAVLGPDGDVVAIDHVEDEELVEDRWVVANIALDARDAQAREAATTSDTGADDAGADDAESHPTDGDGPAPADGSLPSELLAPVAAVPGQGHPQPGPVAAPPVDAAAVVGTVLAGLGVGQGEPVDDAAASAGPAPGEPADEHEVDSGPDEVEVEDGSDDGEPADLEAAEHDASGANEGWPPVDTESEPLWADAPAGHDLPYAPEADAEGDDDKRRSRVRMIEIVLLVIVVIVAALIIAAYSHKDREKAGPPAIGSAASVVSGASSTTARSAPSTTSPATASTLAPSTLAPSTVPASTSTSPATATTSLPSTGNTAGPINFHIGHCSEVNATKIVASGTVAGAVAGKTAYKITVAVVSPSGKDVLGQSEVTVPMARDGASMSWQVSIALPAGGTPGGCKLVNFDFA